MAWTNFTGLNFSQGCNICPGGYLDALIGRIEDIDFANTTFSGNQLTALAFDAAAGPTPLRRFKAAPTENTTHNANGARENDFSPMLYPINLIGQFYEVSPAFALNMDELGEECNLFALIQSQCCECIVEGLRVFDNCAVTPELAPILKPLKLRGDNFDLGNIDTQISNIVTLGGSRNTREMYIDKNTITWASLLALAA